MRSTAPPDDFELFIYPEYILRYRETVRVNLTTNMGELLSILMGLKGANVSAREIEQIMFNHRIKRFPEWGLIYQTMHLLKKKLLSRGFVLNVNPEPGRQGYKFTGFDVISPQSDPIKIARRNARHGRLRNMALLNTNLPIPSPLKVLPPDCESAQNAPWHFPARLEFSREK